MKVIIQVFEVAIGLTIALFMFNAFTPLLDSSFFTDIQDTFIQLANLFGSKTTASILTIFVGIFMVYCGRWIFSRASNN